MKGLLFAIALAGCSTHRVIPDGGIDGGPESFAHQYGRAVCDAIEGCCTKNHFTLQHDACITVVAGEMQEQVNDAATVGKKIDPDAAARCLAEARATFQACPTDDWEAAQTRLLSACDVWLPLAQAGMKAPDASCTHVAECSPVGCDAVSCEGKCVCHREAGIGQPCTTDFQDDCPWAHDYQVGYFIVFRGRQFHPLPSAWPYYCDIFKDAGPTCTATSPLGAPCDSNMAIGGLVPSCGGASCDPTTKTCVRAGIGEPCGTTYRNPQCVLNAYCDYSTNTCQPKHDVGQHCGAGYFQGDGCTSGFCDLDARSDGGFDGRCLASPFAPYYVCGSL